MGRRRKRNFVDFAGNTWDHNCGCGQSQNLAYDCGCGSQRPYRTNNRLDRTYQSDDDAKIDNFAGQVEDIYQGSHEVIEIRDSYDVDVTSTDTQIALSIKVAIQIAIAFVVNITIADSDRAEQVTNDLLQHSDMQQVNRQKVIIERSEDINVTTNDTDIALSLQILVQILIAILIQLDIL
ncbi:spore coat protein X [Salinibacillus kushneri]|uniref:Spore coat protein X n=1 Tax=Salinibacillus kushneri TaxID=237682 RepID=A0A1I0GRV1_9BACI|nr:spore coat protein [Salinibacillus kushneri]SET73825.1 spore coat protein X [Salinibacillus kushneri]